MLVAEIEFVERWLYSTLAGDPLLAQVGIYSSLAPPSAVYPLVIYAPLAPADVFGNGPERIFVRGEWKIVAVGRTPSYRPLVPLADRIDTLLHNSSFFAATGAVFACVRIEPFALVEQGEQGVVYRQLGGIYRIWTKEYRQ
jgi:hypothetical protein